MKNDHLPAKLVWVTYKYQLWPSIRYGIGTMINDMKEAEELLDAYDYDLLNILLEPLSHQSTDWLNSFNKTITRAYLKLVMFCPGVNPRQL